MAPDLRIRWWRGQDLNLRPSGCQPDGVVQLVGEALEVIEAAPAVLQDRSFARIAALVGTGAEMVGGADKGRDRALAYVRALGCELDGDEGAHPVRVDVVGRVVHDGME